ncbi:MAG: PilZ domain-containing protein [Bdellovibrionia bacterium]
MSEAQSHSNELTEVTDPLEIIKYFDEAVKISAATLIWTQEHPEPKRCSFMGLSQLKKLIFTTPPLDCNRDEFYPKLQAAGDRCLFNVSLERATLFFPAQLISTSFTHLEFSLPKRLFRAQRRKNQRFRILQGYVLRVEFVDPRASATVIRKKIYDISSGGLSFLTEDQERMPFYVGQRIEGMSISLRSETLTLCGEVLHLRRLPKSHPSDTEEKIKVGIVFRGINPAHAKLIEAYVAEETRKFFARIV